MTVVIPPAPDGWQNAGGDDDDGAEELAERRAQVKARAERSKLAPKLPSEFQSAVVGVSFMDGYPETLHRLHELVGRRYLDDHLEEVTAVLIRNPENPYDSNAVQVHIPALGESAMVGHLPGVIAARVAPVMDGGGRLVASVAAVAIARGRDDRPGLTVRVRQAALD